MEETAVVAEVNYDAMTSEEVLETMGKAFKAKDMKLVGQLSKLYTKKEAEAEKAAKDALLAELAAKTDSIKTKLDVVIQKMYDSGELDGADGVWYAWDFGESTKAGTACRLMKGKAKVAGEGTSSGKSSYVANPTKSADLLAQVGEHTYFVEDTTVTIDKVEQVMPAGTTFKEAYEFSTNGGWRNRVRMALLKEAGII